MTERTESPWLRYPEASRFLGECLVELEQVLPQLRALADRIRERAGCRLADCLDHLVLADGKTPRRTLARLGFRPEAVPVEANDVVMYHPGAQFPRVLLRADASTEPGEVIGGALGVEEVSTFLMTHQLVAPIEGTVLGPYRRSIIWRANGCEFLVVERRGHRGFIPVDTGPEHPLRYLQALEKWATRPRSYADPVQGMEFTLKLARSLVDDLGTDAAACAVFEVERAYWQRRCPAGQVQRARQESLGLGWANHDHHTFRSSRQSFHLLVRILETFGFRARERFYAGAEAGWGAQVMEQPVCGLVVFADVDLSPEEVEGDIAHSQLPQRDELGTVGLWCALHGESMLGAGLHHLAARCDFDRLTDDLASWGIRMMRPFSEFPYLRQAFTRGERWEVGSDRLDNLTRSGCISTDQRQQFAREGAIGSHLENIQRAEGFKGFNQQTISDIIHRTDPRRGR